jgi:hypothetical protein
VHEIQKYPGGMTPSLPRVSRWLAACMVLAMQPALAATFVVTTTANSGTGSLRTAINSANATVGADVIEFDIPGLGPHTIAPLTALPTITDAVVIDGYSQTDAVPNSAREGSNARIQIRIDGASAGASGIGLSVCQSDVEIRGLSVTRFAGKGISVGLLALGCGFEFERGLIHGNFIGLLPDGSTAGGNGVGLTIDGAAGITVGGLTVAQRNLISGNTSHGMEVRSDFDDAQPVILIRGNWIGTDASGLLDRGNGGNGINLGIDASRVFVGNSGAPNRISFNQRGILVSANSNQCEIFANDISDNDLLGIDLGATGIGGDGVTPNDIDDADGAGGAGGNGLQNFPVLSNVSRTATGIHVEGALDRPPTAGTQVFLVRVYANPVCDASGHGEGKLFLGQQDLFLSAASPETFAFDIDTDLSIPVGTVISATATDANDNTSEFSACASLDANASTFTVTNTLDSGAGSLRKAILDANAHAGGDRIFFNIPGAGPHVIPHGATELPNITDTVDIDGFTQPGASPNSAPSGNNAVHKLHLQGALLFAHAFRITSHSTRIRGLSLTGYDGESCISIGTSTEPAPGTVLVGNLLGIAPDGVVKGCSGIGIRVLSGLNFRIGGNAPADRNVISASGVDATAGGNIVVTAEQASSGLILGNLIGTNPSGSAAVVNPRNGIHIIGQAGPIEIGGRNAVSQNRIVGQNKTAIQITGNNASGITIEGNSIDQSGAVGIDLAAAPLGDGVTANDTNDADTGPNGTQNFPVLSTLSLVQGQLQVTGTLDVPSATSDAVYRLSFYESATCNAAGNGEGAGFIGTIPVRLSAAAQGFTVRLGTQVTADAQLTATATDPSGNTSEFSACRLIPEVNIIFRNGFE